MHLECTGTPSIPGQLKVRQCVVEKGKHDDVTIPWPDTVTSGEMWCWISAAH